MLSLTPRRPPTSTEDHELDNCSVRVFPSARLRTRSHPPPLNPSPPPPPLSPAHEQSSNLDIKTAGRDSEAAAALDAEPGSPKVIFA